ncbi:hypothetical protein [Namhaeicola litoreus]|uniref:Curlin associated repeat-containing protein n=1 Tax=Namhaeicola litoreus TaxID=1052145 RepID=A0ABW3XX95_9FLAO
MRKSYVCAFALMIGAIGFAQNNQSTVEQKGSNGESKVVQDGQLNTAIQYQTSNTGLVNIFQQGTSNYANQDQDKQWQGNTSFDVNPSKMFMTIKQIGERNRAWQTQRWSSQTAIAEQRGNDNTSRQFQSGNHGNLAEVYQRDNMHTATQNQTGETGSWVYINQSGYKNTATQNQIKGIANSAEARQSGARNTSTQTQKGFGSFWGDKNIVKVNQSGNDNIATQDQSNPGNIHGVYPNNIAEIIQSANDGLAVQNQYGLDGFQRIEQKNGRDNYGYQYQDVASERGDARLMQNGSGNWSQQWQYGTDNTSNVNQTGNGMWSKVTQSGAGNTNTVIQTN